MPAKASAFSLPFFGLDQYQVGGRFEWQMIVNDEPISLEMLEISFADENAIEKDKKNAAFVIEIIFRFRKGNWNCHRER